MGEKIMMKGTEAVAEAAIRAGCRYFAGYPITPQSELPEYMSRKLPQVGGIFMQGESELASANMLYGASPTGVRCMTSSSSCGLSLKAEPVSYIAAARLPVVICDWQRGGPGVGTIQPAQQDYNQCVKGFGNGGFEMICLTPGTIQEAVDMTYIAFDLAEKYLCPVMLLVDGVIGTMMEPVELPPEKTDEEIKALREARKNRIAMRTTPMPTMISSGAWSEAEMQKMNEECAEVYKVWKTDEVKYDTYLLDDAEVVLTGYGISGRIALSAANMLRAEGIKAGVIRPLRVNPFPIKAFDIDYTNIKGVVVAEMSIPAQYGADVANYVGNRAEIAYALCSGGNILDRDAVVAEAKKLCSK